MNTIDLFAGCGGLSLGFQNAGFDIKAAFDNWKPAMEVYRANFNHQVFDLDLSQNFGSDVLKEFDPQMISAAHRVRIFRVRESAMRRSDVQI